MELREISSSEIEHERSLIVDGAAILFQTELLRLYNLDDCKDVRFGYEVRKDDCGGWHCYFACNNALERSIIHWEDQYDANLFLEQIAETVLTHVRKLLGESAVLTTFQNN